MKLAAVLLAIVFYFVESVELNPRVSAYYPFLIGGLTERYQFKKVPQKPEDYDESKGIVLAVGKLGDKTIQQITIYSWGLTLDTASSTRDSEELLDEGITWATKEMRLHYSPEMIRRKLYVSQILFYSDAPLLSLNPVFDVVGNRISEEVSNNVKLPYRFQPNSIRFGIDPEEQRIPVQMFSIERRDATAFSEGKYFSAAPVSTDTHLSIIEEFERATTKKAGTK
jgi:hypothetical protein